MIYLLILAALIIVGLVVAALCLLVTVAQLRRELQATETQVTLAEEAALAHASELLKRREKEIRADAIKRSTAVVKGKVAEHLVPFREDFGYNPRDARFLGSPIDFIIFDGLTEGTLDQIIFVEVKAGRFKSLSGRERQVRNVVDEGSVSWELLHVGGKHDQA